jgi:Ca-activated chloride channel family protein
MTTSRLPLMDPAEAPATAPGEPDAGFGALQSPAGNLPLEALQVQARIVGLSTEVTMTQRFVNPHGDPIEAVYVFPLPDRGAVTAMRMTAADRTVIAELRERAAARREYEAAVAAGQRASLAEQDRPDVFSMRVGNILPGERVSIELTVVGVLPVDDEEATFRFPLVVAPRYIPGEPLPSDSVGDGYASDTDAVPDASRITPPVLLPGFPNPVRLDVEIDLDPAGLAMGAPRSSLHAIQVDGRRIRIEPGARVDRDVVLRIPLGRQDLPCAALALIPDSAPDCAAPVEGTFELTVLPPVASGQGRPRDVVLLLDRSGSMSGWKMVAARRAAARIIDTLTDHDRFAVLAFDDRVEWPTGLPGGLSTGSDRHRFRAVEFLAGLTARGGTDLSEPLGRSLALLDDSAPERDRVLVLVTDGQVGNEDQLIRAHARAIGDIRLHTVGIDRAVNAGFLGRLASLGGGRCELVESEDRLDQAMAGIHRRIGSPLVTGLVLESPGLAIEPGTVTPARLPDLFAGVPYVLRGRYRAAAAPAPDADGDADAAGPVVTLRGALPDGTPWSVPAQGRPHAAPAITAAWARARLRDLEDRYVAEADRYVGLGEPADRSALEHRIVQTSLRFGVLCRFTAFVAVDDRVVADGTTPRTVIQPVEPPSGWEPMPAPAPMARMAVARSRVTRMAPLGSAPVEPQGFASAPVGFASGGFSSGSAGVPAGPAAGSSESGAQDQSLLRGLLAVEARRLRELGSAAEHQRREALLDLGTRLIPLAADIPDGAADHGPWAALLDLLRSERLRKAPIDELWAEVLGALDALSPEPGGLDTRAAARRPGLKRPAFWRHFPDR